MVGPREPCPCGSGRRYKACHGRGGADAVVPRPFEGLAGESDWIALRELVPAGSLPLTLADPAAAALLGDRPLVAATVLPLAWAAMVRSDGAVFLGVQVPPRSGDVSRDLAATLLAALGAGPGSAVPIPGPPATGPRLQDLLGAEAAPLTVHDGFDFWIDGVAEPTGEVAASLERANSGVVPTVRLAGVEAAYWCRMGQRNHLRWVLPYPEEPLLDALARLATSDAISLGAGTRYVGSFRAHGRLVPVWDLPASMGAAEVEEPAARWWERLTDARAVTGPLGDADRRARAGLLGRQVTLR